MQKILPFSSLPKTKFCDEKDDDLLIWMSLKGEDFLGAREAFNEFYIRHVGYLYGVSLRRYHMVAGGEPGVKDLVQDTFHKVFERAHTFQKSDSEEPTQQTWRVRAWLGRIAENLLRDRLRKHKHESIVDPHELPENPDTDNWGSSEPNIDEEPNAQRLAAVRQALESLTERERQVLLVTYEYFQEGKEHQRLPNAVAAKLADDWNTKPENIRAIRSRALKKVKAYIDTQAQ